MRRREGNAEERWRSTFLVASTERHKARGDEVVKVAAAAAPDALFPVVEAWWREHHICMLIHSGGHRHMNAEREREKVLLVF